MANFLHRVSQSLGSILGSGDENEVNTPFAVDTHTSLLDEIYREVHDEVMTNDHTFQEYTSLDAIIVHYHIKE